MLRKWFALSYFQVDKPIKILDRDELNDNIVSHKGMHKLIGNHSTITNTNNDMHVGLR